MKSISITKYFVGQRRLMAAVTSAILVYLIVHYFGGQIGISDGIQKTMIYLIILSTTVSAFVTRLVHKKFHIR